VARAPSASPAPAAEKPSAVSPERLKKRRENAKKEYDQFQPMRDDAYRFAIPYRKSTKDSGTGEQRVNEAYDHTAIDAAFRFAGKLQQDMWPAEQSNFQLEAGPLVPQDQVAALNQQLHPITKVVGSFFDDPDWGLSFHEMAIDLCAGTGAILMNATSEPDKLWEPIAVSTDELLLEAGANGKISGVFWDRKMVVRVLEETWPDGKFGEKLKKLIAEEPEKEVVVHHDAVRQKGANGAWRWHLIIWLDEQKDAPVHTSETRTSPWLIPRYFRVAGETWGRGLVHLAMPAIKTVNTAQRLQLQAAAIALLGIYTAIDDGVFNPDLSPLAPGAFWKVASNGGVRGASVQRLQDPRLDLSGLVVTELRQGVRSTMMDDDLPLSSEAVKSPTEIVERVKKSASNHLGAFERLVKEITIPAVKRAIELAYDRGLLPAFPNIDQLLLKLKINSPMAIARAAQRVQRNLEWLQMVALVEQANMATPRIKRIAKTDAILDDAARNLGVDPSMVTDEAGRQKYDQDEQAAMMAQAAAAMGGGAMA
jgi:hypothetical protein